MAVNFLVDTSAYTAFQLNNSSRITSHFTSENTIFFPFVVIGELKGGFRHGTQVVRNERLLGNVLDMHNTDILFPTLETVERYGAIYAQLRKIGRPIGTNDIWIAALALEHNLPLLTTDQDFQCIPSLRLL